MTYVIQMLSDIDQCDNDMDNDCDIYAECINIEGLYNCSCQPGYRGNGTENNCSMSKYVTCLQLLTELNRLY